jgi:hypothetical protein
VLRLALDALAPLAAVARAQRVAEDLHLACMRQECLIRPCAEQEILSPLRTLEKPHQAMRIAELSSIGKYEKVRIRPYAIDQALSL